MTEIFRYNYPTTILYGPGARRRLPEALHEARVKKPLVVTDRGLHKLPLIGELTDILRAAGLDAQVFAEIWGNPVKSQVVAGVKSYKDTARDSIVAVGGGAALDVAKAIA